jgi:hypothetical protein
MRKYKNNQDGFGAIEALLVCLVIIVLGATSFLVFKHSHKTSTKTASTPASQTPAKQPTTGTIQAEQPAPKYLTIKEWGVRLPLSDSIKDAYYLADTNSKGSDGITKQIYVGLKSVDNDGCAVISANGVNSKGQVQAVAIIFRAKPTDEDPVTGKPYSEKTPIGATIGGYFYGYESFANVDSTDCKVPQTTADSVNSAFASALKAASETP